MYCDLPLSPFLIIALLPLLLVVVIKGENMRLFVDQTLERLFIHRPLQKHGLSGQL
jgi:hypothetical protein